MKNTLIQAVTESIINYANVKNRGYKLGFFSHWRHGFAKTELLSNLEKKLRNSANDEQALAIIIEHLLAKNSTFHHHSFNSYLIDLLKKSVKQIDWDCFTPMGIKQYQGTVYRGTSQPPERIFSLGFNDRRPSAAIEDYLRFINYGVGISTSKSFDCAMEYAINTKRSFQQRYIYVINYQGDEGYDILETGKARGVNFKPFINRSRFSMNEKHEVNIKNVILNTDIIGAWKIAHDGTSSWLDNPHYQAETLLLANAYDKNEFKA